MSITSFEQLEVWQDAHQLVLAVYHVTARFPADERFGIVSQMKRAAVSVPANIAEGFGRRGEKSKLHFYSIAKSSLEELRYYLILSKDLGFQIDYESMMAHADRVARMLAGLMRVIIRKGL